MLFDDPRDPSQLVRIVSLLSWSTGPASQKLRVAAIALDVDARWLTSITGTEPERIPAFAVDGRHVPMLAEGAYSRLTIRL